MAAAGMEASLVRRPSPALAMLSLGVFLLSLSCLHWVFTAQHEVMVHLRFYGDHVSLDLIDDGELRHAELPSASVSLLAERLASASTGAHAAHELLALAQSGAVQGGSLPGDEGRTWVPRARIGSGARGSYQQDDDGAAKGVQQGEEEPSREYVVVHSGGLSALSIRSAEEERAWRGAAARQQPASDQIERSSSHASAEGTPRRASHLERLAAAEATLARASHVHPTAALILREASGAAKALAAEVQESAARGQELAAGKRDSAAARLQAAALSGQEQRTDQGGFQGSLDALLQSSRGAQAGGAAGIGRVPASARQLRVAVLAPDERCAKPPHAGWEALCLRRLLSSCAGRDVPCFHRLLRADRRGCGLLFAASACGGAGHEPCPAGDWSLSALARLLPRLKDRGWTDLHVENEAEMLSEADVVVGEATHVLDNRQVLLDNNPGAVYVLLDAGVAPESSWFKTEAGRAFVDSDDVLLVLRHVVRHQDAHPKVRALLPYLHTSRFPWSCGSSAAALHYAPAFYGVLPEARGWRGRAPTSARRVDVAYWTHRRRRSPEEEAGHQAVLRALGQLGSQRPALRIVTGERPAQQQRAFFDSLADTKVLVAPLTREGWSSISYEGVLMGCVLVQPLDEPRPLGQVLAALGRERKAAAQADLVRAARREGQQARGGAGEGEHRGRRLVEEAGGHLPISSSSAKPLLARSDSLPPVELYPSVFLPDETYIPAEPTRADLAPALVRALRDPARLQAMADAALRRALEGSRPNRVAEDISDALEQALHARGWALAR